MGGDVRVIVRQKDGKVVKMTRWTNNLPAVFKTFDFISNPTKTLKSYIKNKGKQPKNYFSPDGYGLIVVDEKSNTILSHQDYTSFHLYSPYDLMEDLDLSDNYNSSLVDSPVPFIDVESFSEEELSEGKAYYKYFMAGGIQADQDTLSQIEDGSSKFSKEEQNDYVKVSKILKKEKRTSSDWKMFLEYLLKKKMLHFDCHLGKYKALTFNEYKQSPEEYLESWVKMRHTLLKMNFKFTKNDNIKWSDYLFEAIGSEIDKNKIEERLNQTNLGKNK